MYVVLQYTDTGPYPYTTHMQLLNQNALKVTNLSSGSPWVSPPPPLTHGCPDSRDARAEHGNGKQKWKTEMENRNGKQKC